MAHVCSPAAACFRPQLVSELVSNWGSRSTSVQKLGGVQFKQQFAHCCQTRAAAIFRAYAAPVGACARIHGRLAERPRVAPRAMFGSSALASSGEWREAGSTHADPQPPGAGTFTPQPF
jgi:hypothetical protein